MKLSSILFTILGLLIIVNIAFMSIIVSLIKDINYIEYKVSNISNKIVMINNTIIKKQIVGIGSHYPQEWISNYSQGRFYGVSMQPSIFENNWVLTKDVNLTYVIKQGDIVRYDTEGDLICVAEESIFPKQDRYIVHRVLFINNKDSIFVKGDNNEYGEYIKRCQIKSVVVGVMFT